MLEIEAKYLLSDQAEIEQRLRELGGELVEERRDEDYYLNAPDRDFARTDEAFRLRRIGENNFLTYKGPRHDSLTKSRQELEFPCLPGQEAADKFLQLFNHLGYRYTATVRKQRRIYELRREKFIVHACLDRVEKVGQFIELEIVAEPAYLEEARAVLFKLAQELNLGKTEPRSYLEMLLESN